MACIDCTRPPIQSRVFLGPCLTGRKVIVSNCGVMIVNCFPDERDMYVQCLERAGYTPIEVCNAEEAVQAAVSRRPKVVITDTALHGSDGLEMIRSLRRDHRTCAATIVVVTGRAFPADRAEAEAAGCDVFLAKPCLPDVLIEAVDRACSRTHGDARAAG